MVQNNIDKFDRIHEFDIEFYGFKKVSKYILKFIEMFQKLKLTNNVFYQEIIEENFDLRKKSLISYYRGHWQDTKYIDRR